jgi:ribosomal protein S20
VATRKRLPPERRRRGASALAPTLGLLLVTALSAGCGGDRSAADAVPALSTRLDKVDAAIVDHDDAAARAALKSLAATADRAERAGDLDEDQAARIDDAVAALLARLAESEPSAPSDGESSSGPPETSQRPEPESTSTPVEPPSPKPPKPPKPPKSEHHDKPEHHGHSHGHGHGHGHGH